MYSWTCSMASWSQKHFDGRCGILITLLNIWCSVGDIHMLAVCVVLVNMVLSAAFHLTLCGVKVADWLLLLCSGFLEIELKVREVCLNKRVWNAPFPVNITKGYFMNLCELTIKIREPWWYLCTVQRHEDEIQSGWYNSFIQVEPNQITWYQTRGI